MAKLTVIREVSNSFRYGEYDGYKKAVGLALDDNKRELYHALLDIMEPYANYMINMSHEERSVGDRTTTISTTLYFKKINEVIETIRIEQYDTSKLPISRIKDEASQADGGAASARSEDT